MYAEAGNEGALLEAVAARKLIILAGSGVSYDSGLPSADAILRHSLRRVLPAEALCHEDAFAQLQPELVYEAIIRITGDRRCLRPWSILAARPQARLGFAPAPNPVHAFLASYSFAAGVPLVTPNFDTMFERAAADLGIPYSVFLPHHTPPSNFDKLAICKIHGSAETEDGDFDADSLWTTASEISTFNAEWMNWLARFSIGRHWCFVGYSGRDIDILPHIAHTGGAGSSIFWIDRFADNPAAAANAARASALCIEGYASEVFHRLALIGPIPSPPPRHDHANMLDTLADTAEADAALTEPQQHLIFAALLRHVAPVPDALAVLDGIDADAVAALPRSLRFEFLLAKAWCFHEQSRYTSLARVARQMLRLAIGDRDAFIHALTTHAESIRMRIPADTYFPATPWLLLPAVGTALLYFVTVDVLIRASLALTGKPLATLPRPGTRHAIMEHRIRLLAIMQRAVLASAGFLSRPLRGWLARAWNAIRDTCHRLGYAAGMANAGKFLFRIAPDAGHGDASRIYGMFAERTGLELLRRNEADAAFARGDFANALAAYRDFVGMARYSGNTLNLAKGLLGICRVCMASDRPPPADTQDELAAVMERIEGRLWRRHLHATLKSIRRSEVGQV